MANIKYYSFKFSFPKFFFFFLFLLYVEHDSIRDVQENVGAYTERTLQLSPFLQQIPTRKRNGGPLLNKTVDIEKTFELQTITSEGNLAKNLQQPSGWRKQKLFH